MKFFTQCMSELAHEKSREVLIAGKIAPAKEGDLSVFHKCNGEAFDYV